MDKLKINLLKNMGVKSDNPNLSWKNPYFNFITTMIGWLVFISFFVGLIGMVYLMSNSMLLNMMRGGGSMVTDLTETIKDLFK